MGLDLVYGKGQTPLTEEEKEGLLLKHITTQGQLNEAEQLNIEEAVQWTLQKRFNASDILSEAFVRELHKRMYRDVWRWASEFRLSDKNIGVDWKQVPMMLRGLVDDCQFWIDHKTFPEDEIAVRFKHRIVSIHCFPNGNGRHSRLMADVIGVQIFGREAFTWGKNSYKDLKRAREDYIAALKKADNEEMADLLTFARS